MHTVRATCCMRAAQRVRSRTLHASHDASKTHTTGQWHKFKIRANCDLSPFMYGYIWGMKVLDNLINIYLFIPLCLLNISCCLLKKT